MSRANLLALGLAVAGLGFVLFGVLAFSAPLLDGPDALLRFIAQTFPPGQGPPPLLAALLRQAPYLFWLVGVAFCSAPGFLLISLAALIRLKVARPRELEDLRQADAGSAREALLQWLVRECVEGSGEDAAGRAARIYGAATRTVGDLDPERRTRFRLFLREAGLEPEGFEVPTPSRRRRRRTSSCAGSGRDSSSSHSRSQPSWWVSGASWSSSSWTAWCRSCGSTCHPTRTP